MNLIEVFVDLIDAIYYPGYAEKLAVDDPQKFNFEFNEFLNQYGSGF